MTHDPTEVARAPPVARRAMAARCAARLLDDLGDHLLQAVDVLRQLPAVVGPLESWLAACAFGLFGP